MVRVVTIHPDEAERAAIIEAFGRVIDSGQYILGAEVAALENEIANFMALTAPAVGVANATDAIELVLRALGIGHGDEVLIPAFAPIPVAAGVAMAGAQPMLVDVDIATATLAPDRVAAALTPRTKAVLVVHLYGNAADLSGISSALEGRDVVLIEDISQAFGSCDNNGRLLGTTGVAAVLSMYPTKNLAALGDAGCVLSENLELLTKVRALRQYGWDTDRVSQQVGRNSRMDEIQAAVLRMRLRLFETYRETRRNAYERLARLVVDLELGRVVTDNNDQRLPHLFVIETANRSEVRSELHSLGIETSIHYDRAIHQHPAFSSLDTGSLGNAERLATNVLTIPWDQVARIDAANL